MKKRNLLIVALAVVFSVVLFLFWNGENALVQESIAAPKPLDGVSITVSATKRKVEYTIESLETDYIVYDGYSKSISLEMLEDGKWYVVGDRKTGHDAPAAISPGNSNTVKYRWKDIHEHNMKKGQYRLVYTFWAMPRGEDGERYQTDNYVVMQEFSID